MKFLQEKKFSTICDFLKSGIRFAWAILYSPNKLSKKDELLKYSKFKSHQKILYSEISVIK